MSFGAFLSWHCLPTPHTVEGLRSGIGKDTPLPVVIKSLQQKGGLSVPAAVLLEAALRAK